MNSRLPGVQDQGKSEWESSEGWDVNEESQYHQNGRLNWDNSWENPMALSQNPLMASSGDGINITDHSRSSFLLSGWPATQGVRHHSQIFQASPSFSSDNSGFCAQPTSLRGCGSVVEALQNMMQSGPGYHGFSCISGASEISNELKPLEQRRRYLGILDLDQRADIAGDIMKAEDLFYQGDVYDRIGLNLGRRTYFSPGDSMRIGKRPHLHASSVHLPICQAQGCTADLSRAKHYYRRHKVCEMHSKAAQVLANGQTQRFCQQCSRLHLVTEFDDAKRSCRKRLADHNRRRRKPQITAPQINDNCKADVTACKPEDNDTMAANNLSNISTDTKPEAGHSKEARSSSELMEELPGSTNGVVTQSLDYGFFRSESANSGQPVLQLKHANSSPVSDSPSSLRSPMNHHSSSLLQFQGDTNLHLPTLPSPEIYRSGSNSQLGEADARKSRDSNLSRYSQLETGVGFEDRYQMQQLTATSHALFDHEVKASAPWLTAAFSKPAEEMTKSPIDFQQLMPAREGHDLNASRSVRRYGSPAINKPSPRSSQISFTHADFELDDHQL